MYKKTITKTPEKPYCLHDMHLIGLDLDNNDLTLRFQYGFFSITPPFNQVDGYIKLCGLDLDFCYVYLLEYTDVLCGNIGHFNGEKIGLSDFIKKYDKISLNIMDETYGYNCVRLEGFFNVNRKCLECILEIYHSGDMIYFTEE